ncbi:RimK family protein [Aestuariispira insulae]|uniref:Glutathione synthase/RimK-type ligase-like ATP-grasp enzyme n=1 Tax=Aestuariispira insulae TaxID=1461337 RepID=A0A3D9H3U8_9PROT|nr:RimK family protein [Aestuariispira insulae]RED44169.1 glutathione synthase/RimK-type ligase-like ATP-grasp enzyme [Aestuariispira insulae]
MARYTIIVDRMSDWKWPMEGLNLMTAETFLTQTGKARNQTTRVINLCRNYKYLSAGYYCSLLAEARGQIPMPTVADVLILQEKNQYSDSLPELDAILNKTVKRLTEPPEGTFQLTVLFGRATDSRFKKLADVCFDIFRYPAMRLEIRFGSRWKIHTIRPLGLHQIQEEEGPIFKEALLSYTRLRKQPSGERPPALYSLAILVEPEEALPPSDQAALDRFIRIGQSMRMEVEIITRKDYRRIPEFDALFIRTNTNINHYTYEFARKAEQEGLAVIDDPSSILHCTNKVYLHEILETHKIPAPRSRTINRANFGPELVAELERDMGYPIILKIPDGSFSRGMYKAENAEQVLRHGAELLEHSRLILAQEFVYTKFDWRVGLLRGEPLYVCQYMMSGKHWQIVNHKADGSFRQGSFKTFAVDEAPAQVIRVAKQAAALMGDGLYGVDVKETEKGILVIEVNDNPSLDHGVEDKVIKDTLYRSILEEFIRRIETRH